jgi:hypothetical protein
MLDVRDRSGGEIIDHVHFVAIFEQTLAKMRPNETRTTRYQSLQLQLLAT